MKYFYGVDLVRCFLALHISIYVHSEELVLYSQWKVMLADRHFLTRLLIGWQQCCHPIRSHVRKLPLAESHSIIIYKFCQWYFLLMCGSKSYKTADWSETSFLYTILPHGDKILHSLPVSWWLPPTSSMMYENMSCQATRLHDWTPLSKCYKTATINSQTLLK